MLSRRTAWTNCRLNSSWVVLSNPYWYSARQLTAVKGSATVSPSAAIPPPPTITTTTITFLCTVVALHSFYIGLSVCACVRVLMTVRASVVISACERGLVHLIFLLFFRCIDQGKNGDREDQRADCLQLAKQIEQVGAGTFVGEGGSAWLQPRKPLGLHCCAWLLQFLIRTSASCG